MSRSAKAAGGRIVSYRPAGSSTRRAAQSSRRARSASSAPTSISLKSRVPWPAQAERAISADLALRSTFPVGWSCRSRSPVDVPVNVLTTECSANPYSFRPAVPAASSAWPSAPATSRKIPISVPLTGSSQPGPRLPAGASIRNASLSPDPSKGRASSAGEPSDGPPLRGPAHPLPPPAPGGGRRPRAHPTVAPGPQQRPRVLRGRTLRGRLLGGPDDLLDLIVVHAGPGEHADGGLFAAPADGDNCQLA